MTEGGDIAYRVYWKNSDGNIFDLVPFDRVDSHLIMEEGHLTCEQAGKCIIFIFKQINIQNNDHINLVSHERCDGV